MKKTFEPLKLDICYFEEMDAITCSFPADDNETGILGGGFTTDAGEFV